MEVRPATAADGEAIERIARDSFRASYALSPDDIDLLVEAYFTSDALAARLDGDDDGAAVFVATAEDDVIGFAEVAPGGWLQWLHVDPTERGQGAGTGLVERARDELGDEPLTAHVLEAASEGSAFLERFGLSPSGTTDLDYGEHEALPQEVYTAGGEEHEANEPEVEVPHAIEEDGEALRVERNEPIPGTESPFFAVGARDGDPWGYFCSQCGGTDVAADGLDRLACNECGNEHRADQWDGAYL